MEFDLIRIKNAALGALAAGGSIAANLLGGWDAALQTLLTCMAADYLAGIIVAGVFRRSGKSEDGALSSRAGFLGLCRKCGILLCVLVAARLDLMVGGGDYARTAVILFFIGNEGLSVLENLGLMGVPYPAALRGALTALRERGDAAKTPEKTE